jgi:orotidine-5'-phosphate decarboxylase
MEPKERIIVAVDVDSADRAVKMVEELRGEVGAFKVGLELVNAAGLEIFDKLTSAGAARIFYDCKVHDIPNTVAGAMRAIGRRGLWMTNLHASGGSRMISAAATALQEGAAAAGAEPALLLGVTLLTSLSEEELAAELHVPLAPKDYVAALARLVKAAGGNGVVASPHEIEVVREACGPDFLIVTPGVRPAGADAGDQRRVMTPGEAVRRGADYVVIGRAITGSNNMTDAARRIADEIGTALDRRGYTKGHEERPGVSPS